MFPTIFALSIRGLGEHTKQGAFNLVMSICGRGDHDPLMGLVAITAACALGSIIPALLCRDCRLRPRLETPGIRDSRLSVNADALAESRRDFQFCEDFGRLNAP